MSDIEQDKGKNSELEKTHSTSPDKSTENKSPKPKDPATASTSQKSAWDLPDGEYSEVFDSEGHRNRINHY